MHVITRLQRNGQFGTYLGRTLDFLTIAALGVAIWLFLSSQRSHESGSTLPPSALLIPVDSFIERLVVTDSEGRERHLFADGDSVPRLLLLFRTDCPVCSDQLRDWAALAKRARELRVEPLGLTSEPLSASVVSYLEDAGVEVYRIADPVVFLTQLSTRILPTTVLTGPGGRVRAHHVGLLGTVSVEELLASIGS